MQKWRVSKEEAGVKLIDFIQEQLKEAFPNREVKRQIETNRCLVNGVVERFASKKLSVGDRVHFDDEALGIAMQKPVFEAHRILFEDEDILLYDKPAGVTCDAVGILALLKPHGDYILVHRLDKETSGILILAKSAKVEDFFLTIFREHKISKEYLALVDGCPKEVSGVIENALGKIGGYQGQTIYGKVPRDKGQYAKTTWHLKKAAKQAALLLCQPETGRTHQIRVHLCGMGHPILGDHQYAKTFRCVNRPARMLLHASKVTFPHPRSGKTISIEAPIPHDFQEMFKKIW